MSNKKNLLIYAHYYIPDTASTGQILRELAEGMLDKFNITVICVVPSYLGTIEDKYKTQKYYEEEINGVKVLRIRVPEFSKTNKKSDVLKFLLEDNCSLVVRPSGTEPKLKIYISVSAENKEMAEEVEDKIAKTAEKWIC